MKMTHTQEMVVTQPLGGDFHVTDVPIPNILLRSTRRQMHLTQQDVAKKIGVSALSVGRWERGETVPNRYAREMLCKLFHRSAERLGLADEKGTSVSEEIQAANQLILDSRECDLACEERDPSAHRPFHKQLRYERESYGWSQGELAEKIGSDHKTVHRWETGKSLPQPLYRRRLCELFGKNAKELGFLEKRQSQGTEQSYLTRRTISLRLPVYRGDCEQPEIIAFLHTIQIDPSRDSTKFCIQFTNRTEEDMGLRFESLSLVDQNGDFVLGQSIGSFLLGAGKSSLLTVVFDWIPQPKRVYGFNVVLIRPDKWRNTYKPIPLKF